MLVVAPLDLLENPEKRSIKPLPTLKKYSTLTGKEKSITVPVHMSGLVHEVISNNSNVESGFFNLKEHINESLQEFQVLRIYFL